jgi:hypothetical protein
MMVLCRSELFNPLLWQSKASQIAELGSAMQRFIPQTNPNGSDSHR